MNLKKEMPRSLYQHYNLEGQGFISKKDKEWSANHRLSWDAEKWIFQDLELMSAKTDKNINLFLTSISLTSNYVKK
jgi:hypothetical protein